MNEIEALLTEARRVVAPRRKAIDAGEWVTDIGATLVIEKLIVALESLSVPVGANEQEQTDILQDLIDDTAKPSAYPQYGIGVSNPREIAEAVLAAGFRLPVPGGYEYSLKAGASRTIEREPTAEQLADASKLSDADLARRLASWAESVGRGDRIGVTERKILRVLLIEAGMRLVMSDV